MENLNGKADLQNLIPQVWSTRFYESLKNNLVLAALFSSEYEGEIQSRGDTVKVNQITVPAAETLTDDKTKFKSSPITVNQFTLEINRQTVHAVEITNLALLQSEAFMEELRKEMTYQLYLKMEQELLEVYDAAVSQTLTTTAASDFAAIDIAKARAAFGRAKIPFGDRYMVLSPEYYSDLLTKNQIISTDFVNTKPILDQTVPNVLGFGIVESNVLATDTGRAFHKSVLQLAMQRSLNLAVLDQKVNNKLSYSVVADFVWDCKVFEAARGWKQAG